MHEAAISMLKMPLSRSQHAACQVCSAHQMLVPLSWITALRAVREEVGAGGVARGGGGGNANRLAGVPSLGGVGGGLLTHSE